MNTSISVIGNSLIMATDDEGLLHTAISYHPSLPVKIAVRCPDCRRQLRFCVKNGGHCSYDDCDCCAKCKEVLNGKSIK